MQNVVLHNKPHLYAKEERFIAYKLYPISRLLQAAYGFLVVFYLLICKFTTINAVITSHQKQVSLTFPLL